MALIPNLIRTQVTAPGTISTWVDSTVYGGAELLRNQVALYLTAYKVDENLVESSLVVPTFDPETVTTFTTPNTIDGHYKYNFVIIKNWLIGTTYNRYDLVWDTTTNLFYEYVNITPAAGNAVTNINFFIPVTDPTVKIANVGTALNPGNLIYQIINKVVSFQTSICFVKAASKTCKEDCDGDCGCNSKTSKLFLRIRNLYSTLGLNEAQGKYLEGERNARLAEKYCDDCGCLTR